MKPRPSQIPKTQSKFRKSANGGNDRRGGGLVLDCRYELHLADATQKESLLYEVKKFLAEFDGDEKLQEPEQPQPHEDEAQPQEDEVQPHETEAQPQEDEAPQEVHEVIPPQVDTAEERAKRWRAATSWMDEFFEI